MFPELDRALVFTNAGPLILLEGYQTPAGIRRMGTARLTRWLRGRGVRSPQELAATAVGAAEQQHTTVPGEAVIARLVQTLAADVRALNEKIAQIDRLIEDRFRAHDLAEIITSMPGVGPLLGAE
ncbi:IS110 family transposase, partial [Actinoplanes sp. NPDC051346]